MLTKVVLSSRLSGSFTLPQFGSFFCVAGDGSSSMVTVVVFICLLVARNSDSKSTWSPGSVTNTSLAHELWKVPLPPKSITAPSRPPPGLTGQKPPLSTWDNSLRLGGGWGNSDARYTPGKFGCVWRGCFGVQPGSLLRVRCGRLLLFADICTARLAKSQSQSGPAAVYCC